MKIKEYVNDALNNKECERVYENGLSYILIHEQDGWISIVDITNPDNYIPLLQAKDMEHAMSYIALREPLPSGVDVI